MERAVRVFMTNMWNQEKYAFSSNGCAIDNTGDLWCWNHDKVARRKEGRLSNVVDVAMAGSHICALDRSGKVFCFGSGDDIHSTALPNPSTSEYKVTDIVAEKKSKRICGKTEEGPIVCWGGQQCHYEGTRKVCTPEGVHHHLNPDCECKDEWTLNGQTIRGCTTKQSDYPWCETKGKCPINSKWKGMNWKKCSELERQLDEKEPTCSSIKCETGHWLPGIEGKVCFRSDSIESTLAHCFSPTNYKSSTGKPWMYAKVEDSPQLKTLEKHFPNFWEEYARCKDLKVPNASHTVQVGDKHVEANVTCEEGYLPVGGSSTNDAQTNIMTCSKDSDVVSCVSDFDGDGLSDAVETNTGEYVSSTNTGTNPKNVDTDNDGLADGVETNTGIYVDGDDTGTDPNNADTDGDGLADGVETDTGIFDPTDSDTA